MEAILIIIGLLVLIPLIYVIATYNGLVTIRNHIKDAWANIDTELKRRYDLIPNLVSCVKGYAAHERQTLEAVTQARNMAVSAVGKGVGEQAKAEGGLSGALSKLFAVAEQYPNLKANENFLALQEELTSTENKISFARQFYNDSVMTLNNKVQMFPSNIIAGMTGFKAGEFFEVEAAAERQVPKVSFS